MQGGAAVERKGDVNDMAQDKAALRERYLRLRRGISKAAHQKWDAAILEHLTDHLRMLGGRASAPPVMAAYRSHAGEPDLMPALQTMASEGWTVVFPKTQRTPQALHFYSVDLPAAEAVFERGPFGILEPVQNDTRRVEQAEIDIVLLPGIAFSRGGVRLGYGGGYYDRWLANADAHLLRIGVAYEVLLRDELPRAPHDMLVQNIVTESGVFVCVPPH